MNMSKYTALYSRHQSVIVQHSDSRADLFQMLENGSDDNELYPIAIFETERPGKMVWYNRHFGKQQCLDEIFKVAYPKAD